MCQKAVCHDCVARDAPRLLCRTCASAGVPASAPHYRSGYGYGFGFEYRSSIVLGGWPLVHICTGIDPATLRPRVAKGVLAIGNIAIGGLAIGGLAFGLITFGGASMGLLLAFGGMALGFGLSIGGFAVGSFAIGGASVGFYYAIGGAAFAPASIDGRHCDQAVVDFARQWLGGVGASLPDCH